MRHLGPRWTRKQGILPTAEDRVGRRVSLEEEDRLLEHISGQMKGHSTAGGSTLRHGYAERDPVLCCWVELWLSVEGTSGKQGFGGALLMPV